MGKSERVFVRGMSSPTYSLDHLRHAQLAVDRVRDETHVVDDGSSPVAAAAAQPVAAR